MSTSEKHVVLTGGYDHTLRIWDLETRKAVRILEHTAAINKIAVSNDLSKIAYGANSNSKNLYILSLVDLTSAKPIDIVAHVAPVTA